MDEKRINKAEASPERMGTPLYHTLRQTSSISRKSIRTAPSRCSKTASPEKSVSDGGRTRNNLCWQKFRQKRQLYPHPLCSQGPEGERIYQRERIRQGEKILPQTHRSGYCDRRLKDIILPIFAGLVEFSGYNLCCESKRGLPQNVGQTSPAGRRRKHGTGKAHLAHIPKSL